MASRPQGRGKSGRPVRPVGGVPKNVRPSTLTDIPAHSLDYGTVLMAIRVGDMVAGPLPGPEMGY